MSNIQIGLAVAEHYFDSDDYSEPIKLNVNVANNFGVIPSFKKYIRFSLQNNELVDNKNQFPFTSSSKYSFFSIGEVKSDYYVSNEDIIFDMEIFLDSKYQSIKRNVFTLSDMFGMIGGMDSILCILAAFFVKIFSSKIYMLSLISSFYNVKSENNDNIINELKIEESKEPRNILAQHPSTFECESYISWNNLKKNSLNEESSFSKVNNTPATEEYDRNDKI